MTAARPDNPWSATGIGARYALGRPYHHPRSLSRALVMLGEARARRALDVACGTGMSTRALADIADRAVGADGSAEMLGIARGVDGARFIRCDGECLPFTDDAFDAITCCSAVHWFDQPRLFAEVRRVLTPRGWVVLYDHYYIGQMVDVPDFGEWARVAHDRYPLPPRNPQVGDPRSETPSGFAKVGDEFFADDIDMTHEQLVDYQLSISNFVTAVERGTPFETVREWLRDTTAPFYEGVDRRAVRFLGSVTCLRRAPV